MSNTQVDQSAKSPSRDRGSSITPLRNVENTDRSPRLPAQESASLNGVNDTLSSSSEDYQRMSVCTCRCPLFKGLLTSKCYTAFTAVSLLLLLLLQTVEFYIEEPDYLSAARYFKLIYVVLALDFIVKLIYFFEMRAQEKAKLSQGGEQLTDAGSMGTVEMDSEISYL